MNKEIANVIVQFLMRTPLEGKEVPAFNAAITALQEIIEPKPESSRDGKPGC